MGTIKRFEDMQVWRKARVFVNEIYRLTSNGLFSKDFSLRDQIRRVSVSIVLNTAEGFARKSDKEFSQFLVQAHGSTAEVQSALYIAFDQKYLSDDEFDKLYNMGSEISSMLMSLSKYLHLKSKNKKS